MNELVNSCRFIGNLGKDPEMQYTPKGTAMLKFSVAVNEKRYEGDGYVDNTTWLDLAAFGKLAETMVKLLKKGTKIIVDAQYGKSSYEEQDTGKKRTSHNFTVRNFQILSGGRTKDEADNTESGDTSGYSYGEDEDETSPF